MSQDTPLLRRLLLPGLALIALLLGYRNGWSAPMLFGGLFLGLFVLGEITGSQGWRRTAWIRRYNHYASRLTPETAAQIRDELLALRARGDQGPELPVLLSYVYRVLGDSNAAARVAEEAITALQEAGISMTSRANAHRYLAGLAYIEQATAWTTQARFIEAAEQFARIAPQSPYPPDLNFGLAAWNYFLAGDAASTRIMLDNMLSSLNTPWDRRTHPAGHPSRQLIIAYLRHTLRGENMRDDLARYRDQLTYWEKLSATFEGTAYGARLREVLDELRAVLDTL